MKTPIEIRKRIQELEQRKHRTKKELEISVKDANYSNVAMEESDIDDLDKAIYILKWVIK